MYKIISIITLMLSLATLNSFAQEEAINQTINNKKEGLWRTVDKKGKTSEGHYTEGKKSGEWKITRADGTVESIVTWENGRPKGKAIYYYKNGTVMEQGYWNIDHWEGDYSRNNENGNKACEFKYNNEGKREGKQVYYHPNGKIMYDGTWQNGKITGALAVYDTLGIKRMERNYSSDGKFEGSQQSGLDEQQEKDAKINVFNQTGNLVFYDNRGNISKKGYFKNGELINGEEFIYDAKGKLIKKIHYVNGQPSTK